VNTLAKINLPFGSTLTRTAQLPRGAQRSMRDPFAEKKRPWKFYLFVLILLAAFGVLWQKGYVTKWWNAVQHKAEEATQPQPAAPAPEPAKKDS
jgi:hypothetical protein